MMMRRRVLTKRKRRRVQRMERVQRIWMHKMYHQPRMTRVRLICVLDVYGWGIMWLVHGNAHVAAHSCTLLFLLNHRQGPCCGKGGRGR